MSDRISREDAAEYLFVVFDPDGTPADSFDDEDEAYFTKDNDQRVVMYAKA